MTDHPITELVVQPNPTIARHAGFIGERHPQLEQVFCWWPGLGVERLHCSRRYRRITIDPRVRLLPYQQQALRSNQMVFGDEAVWMEL